LIGIELRLSGLRRRSELLLRDGMVNLLAKLIGKELVCEQLAIRPREHSHRERRIS